MALASGVFDTGITWEIKDKLAMLFEWLTGEDLRKQICRVSFARDMLQLHTPSAALSRGLPQRLQLRSAAYARLHSRLPYPYPGTC